MHKSYLQGVLSLQANLKDKEGAVEITLIRDEFLTRNGKRVVWDQRSITPSAGRVLCGGISLPSYSQPYSRDCVLLSAEGAHDKFAQSTTPLS